MLHWAVDFDRSIDAELYQHKFAQKLHDGEQKTTNAALLPYKYRANFSKIPARLYTDLSGRRGD